MEMINAIARRERDGQPILFFPDADANIGMILCATIHGHTESSVDYYLKSTKPADFDSKKFDTGFNMLGYKKKELNLKKRLNYDVLRNIWFKKD